MIDKNYEITWVEGILFLIMCIIALPFLIIFWGFVAIIAGMQSIFRIFIKGEKRQ